MTSSLLFVGIARVNHLADRVLAIYSGHTLALSAMKRSYQRELIVGPARDQGNSVGRKCQLMESICRSNDRHVNRSGVSLQKYSNLGVKMKILQQMVSIEPM
jgi:hypothetical protein